jgi:hypothetical protein
LRADAWNAHEQLADRRSRADRLEIVVELRDLLERALAHTEQRRHRFAQPGDRGRL